jgi:tetratricopeptide (TPR) repeat protein
LVSVAALLPVLGINPFHFQFFSTVADHYMVLAMLGPAIAVAGLLGAPGGRPKTLTLAVTAMFLVILGSLSFLQLRHWHTDEDIIWQTLAISPDSALAHNALGQYYESHDNMKAAEEQFIATQVNEFFFDGTVNLAHLYAYTGQAKKAIAAFHQLLAINDRLPPQVRSDYRNLPVTLAMEAIRAGHRMDVPVYLWEMTRMWLAENFASWLGGSSVKYLPISYEVPGALERSPHQM